MKHFCKMLLHTHIAVVVNFYFGGLFPPSSPVGHEREVDMKFASIDEKVKHVRKKKLTLSSNTPKLQKGHVMVR